MPAARRHSMSRAVLLGLLAVSLVLAGAVVLVSHWLWQRPGIVSPTDVTWEVTATVDWVDLAASTVGLKADLLGIMGAEVVVTPATWIGISGKLASLADLPEGATVRVSFGRDGGRKVARWIAAIPAATADGASDASPEKP